MKSPRYKRSLWL